MKLIKLSLSDNLRKILFNFLIVLSLGFLLTNSTYAAPIKILTITQDFASIAKSVGGDLVEVETLIKGSRNLHHINPKPSMVMKARRADIIIRLGMDQDGWIDGLIEAARNKRLFKGQTGYIDCSEPIKKLEIPTGKIDGSQGDIHKSGNPHYWLNPANGKVIARQIRDRLIQLDPSNKATYSANYSSFSRDLDKRISIWKKALKSLKKDKFVSYHKVWSYFFDAFGLDSVGELEPFPGVPPTTKHLYQLKQALKQTDKKVHIITANFYPTHFGKQFAQSVNGSFYMLSSNVGGLGVESYFDLFDQIVEKLTK